MKISNKGLDLIFEYTSHIKMSRVNEVEMEITAYGAGLLNQNQFDSLVSFVYDIGVEEFRKSSVRNSLSNLNIYKITSDLLTIGDKERREKEKNLFEL